MSPTVCYVVHNHPVVTPGGTEIYAVELFEAMRDSGRYQPVLLARTGPPVSRSGPIHPGTLLEPVAGAVDEYFFHTDIADYDWFLQTSRRKDVYTRFYRDFLVAYRPDVIHFQHTLFLGYDILRETRRTLPEAAIVYTLHDFWPICHNNGQMFRTTGERCTTASPRRCHECFPQYSPQDFFLRERFIKSHLGVVDRFVSPSRFLAQRYVEWGIPAERIVVEENGRRPVALPPSDSAGAEPSRMPRDRFGFFGQVTAFKGCDVLLQAMQILAGRRVRPTLRLHAANLEHQPEEFKARFQHLLDATGDNVTDLGPYRQEELPALMRAVDWVVLPSIWWENAPLVIQEAFAFGRPVICSDIGGMAEMVTDGVDGLHFRAGDPAGLADVMERAARTQGLWDRLRSGIGEVHSLDHHVARLDDLYDEILAGRSRPARVPVPVLQGGVHAG